MKVKFFIISFSLLFFAMSCKENKEKTTETSQKEKVEKTIHAEEVSYTSEGKTYQSFVAYNTGLSSLRPVVFVIPEWWGLNDYAKNRAKQLAELGFYAIALDFYGDGKVVESPDEAGKLATPFYKNSALGKSAFDAGKEYVKKQNNVDLSKMVVIGYCFGGAQALNMARQEPDLKGAVSFHGNLMTGVKPNNNSVKMLVCNGANDTFISAEEIQKFKKEMDSAKIDYTFIDYPNSLHAFTNPNATEVGKKYNLKIAYNKDADEKSWNDMMEFFKKIF